MSSPPAPNYESTISGFWIYEALCSIYSRFKHIQANSFDSAARAEWRKLALRRKGCGQCLLREENTTFLAVKPAYTLLTTPRNCNFRSATRLRCIPLNFFAVIPACCVLISCDFRFLPWHSDFVYMPARGVFFKVIIGYYTKLAQNSELSDRLSCEPQIS